MDDKAGLIHYAQRWVGLDGEGSGEYYYCRCDCFWYAPTAITRALTN